MRGLFRYPDHSLTDFRPILIYSLILIIKKYQNFKAKHGKKYSSSSEESKRFAIFAENLKIADARNDLDPGVHGITKFFDLSQAEFESQYLSLHIPGYNHHLSSGAISSKTNSTRMLSSVAGRRDWTGVLTTPIKNQGGCGR